MAVNDYGYLRKYRQEKQLQNWILLCRVQTLLQRLVGILLRSLRLAASAFPEFGGLSE